MCNSSSCSSWSSAVAAMASVSSRTKIVRFCRLPAGTNVAPTLNARTSPPIGRPIASIPRRCPLRARATSAPIISPVSWSPCFGLMMLLAFRFSTLSGDRPNSVRAKALIARTRPSGSTIMTAAGRWSNSDSSIESNSRSSAIVASRRRRSNRTSIPALTMPMEQSAAKPIGLSPRRNSVYGIVSMRITRPNSAASIPALNPAYAVTMSTASAPAPARSTEYGSAIS